MGRSLALALTAVTAISAALLGGLLVSPPVPSPPPDAEEVRPGVPVVRSPNGHKPDLFTLHLRAGDFLQVTVEQQGIDAVVSLLDAGGINLLTIDFPTGSSGAETLVVVAERPGWHRLRIHALQAEENGRYTLRVEEPRPAGPRERQHARAMRAFAEGEELLARKDGRAFVRALDAYRDAADGLRSAGDERTLAFALDRRGDVADQLGELEEARDAYREAAQIQGRLVVADEIRLLNRLGPIERLLGESRAAEKTLKLAQQKAEQSGERGAEAFAWNELGHLYKSEASLETTLDAYHRARDIWKDLGDRDAEATALHNLGTFYSTLGRLPQARKLLDRALMLRRKAKDRQAEAATLTAIAWVEALAGRLPEALDLCDQALELRKLEKDWRGAAVTLDRRGTVLRHAGRTDEALVSSREALEFFAKSEERGLIAPTLANMGGLLVQAGNLAEGERLLMRALGLFRRSSDQESEAFVWLELARAAHRRGHLALALSRIDEAVRLVDSLRRATPGLELRASYAALRHGYSEMQINLLMEAGFHLRALEASERSRGRALQENLEARSVGIDQEPGERMRSLNAQIQALEARRFGLQEADAPADQVQGIERKITTLLMERDRLRGAPPVHEASSQPPLNELRQLLGTDTLLLEYSLGEERSFLWALGADGLEAWELPGRAVLEPLIQEARKLLSCSHYRTCRIPAEIAVANLGKALLGPVANRRASQRVLIVPDGALYSIPFSALTVERGGPPLLTDHEIVFAPSASLIAQMRRERDRRPLASRLLAVVAAPAYREAVDAEAAPEETLRGSGSRAFLPLPEAEVEAREISKLVPPDQRLAALGFEADRQAVLDGLLEGASIVHFATHAELDPEQPELSSLVLSEIDPGGRPRDGYLRAYEIRDLNLSAADLVVLSACSTGVGPEMRGEGPMGLARAFLDAGAARVVMSLWDVEDKATAELMRRFYQGVLVDGLSPASALRKAQLSMRAEKRWEAPYYWAGFVLQGDWE